MIDRRCLLGSLATAPLLAALPAFGQVKHILQVPSARVIVDNDFSGDPDGLVALAHQLLAPKTVVSLVTVSFLNPLFIPDTVPKGATASHGVGIAKELIERLRPPHKPPVLAGREAASSTATSEAAKAIVAEVLRDDPLPLIFTCGGPLTNLAEALALEPRIASRMRLVWIGGGGYPAGGWEYNLDADVAAARAVIEQSAMPVWQIPQPSYRQMAYSIAEFESELRPISPFTEWLVGRFVDLPPFVTLPGNWPLGDSPLVLLTAISDESSGYRDQPARRILPDQKYGEEIPGRSVRVFERMDASLTFRDMIARFRLHAK